MSATTTTARPLQDGAEVERALKLLTKPNGVFELRCLDAKLDGQRTRPATVSGFFDSIPAALTELAKLESAKGVYVTLNVVAPALLARRKNRLAVSDKGETTGDQHIIRRCCLLIDVDPDRPSGISATDAEKEMARKTARTIYKMLKDQGWPEPVIADSANGVHLRYGVDLPADDGGLLKSILNGLADYFDDGGAKVDRTVYNPARIGRLYGTLACKGDNTGDRPHRTARLVNVPDVLTAVSEDQLRALLAVLTPVAETKPALSVSAPTKSNGTFDVDGFLARYGVAVKDTATEPDGTRKWLLEKCPFNTDHVDGDAAVFERTNGKLGFKCFHNGCDGKHWQDFRNHYEPNRTATTATPAADSEPSAMIEKALVSTTELAGLEWTPREFALRPFLKAGDLGFVYAKRGDGKTWLSMLIAKAISTGTTAGTWTADQPWPVLYVDGEMPAEESKRRILALGGAGDNLLWLQHEIYFERTGKCLNLASLPTQAELTALIQARGVRVLVLDNLSCLFSGVSENDADAWEMVLPWLLTLRRLKIAVVIVAHAGRNGQMRGTSRREDAAFWVLKLERNESDDPLFRGVQFTSLFTKNRNALEDDCPPQQWTITSEPDGTATVTAKPISGVDLLVSWVRAGLESATDIAGDMGLSKGQVSKLAKRAERLGLIVIEKGKYRPTKDV